MRNIIQSIEGEFQRYKVLAEAAMEQLSEAELVESGVNGGNAIAVIGWHLAGNLTSRFSDFLTSDGEKPWRDREDEFAPRSPSRRELLDTWEKGWQVLFRALDQLSDQELVRTITIRGTELSVHEALHRSLAHASYHVGQIVYLAKSFRGKDWRYLSIPPGGTAAYNESPDSERAEAHRAKLQDSKNS